MSDRTVNYEFKKPAVEDFYDIGVQNGNWDKADQGLKDLESKKVNATGGDISNTKISSIDDITTSFPVPSVGDSTKTFLGKVKKFMDDFNDFKSGIITLGKLANNCTTESEGCALDARQGKALLDLLTSHKSSGDHDGRYLKLGGGDVSGGVNPTAIQIGKNEKDGFGWLEVFYHQLLSFSIWPSSKDVINIRAGGESGGGTFIFNGELYELDKRLLNEGHAVSSDHDNRYYTENEIDSKLSNKANNSHTHDDRYYTESEINNKIVNNGSTTASGYMLDARYGKTLYDLVNSKAAAGHNHDGRYYTESEVDSIIQVSLATPTNLASAYGVFVGLCQGKRTLNNFIVFTHICFQFTVKGLAAGTALQLASLPSGYIPKQLCVTSATTSGGAAGVVSMDTNGRITFTPYSKSVGQNETIGFDLTYTV